MVSLNVALACIAAATLALASCSTSPPKLELARDWLLDDEDEFWSGRLCLEGDGRFRLAAWPPGGSEEDWPRTGTWRVEGSRLVLKDELAETNFEMEGGPEVVLLRHKTKESAKLVVACWALEDMKFRPAGRGRRDVGPHPAKE